MVSGSRIDGGAQVLSAGVRKTIQSIKEIVGNHSDADIYVALKETNMDPNETAQKLLNQDPFHEVRRRRDKRKENLVQKSFVAVEPKNNDDLSRVPVKYNTYSDRSSRRGGISRNAVSGNTVSCKTCFMNSFSVGAPIVGNIFRWLKATLVENGKFMNGGGPGASREFRVVRDNRVNHTATTDSKPGVNSTSMNPGMISKESTKSSGLGEPAVGQHSSQAVKSNDDSQPRQTKDAASAGIDRKEMVSEKRFPVLSSRVQTKANASQPQSTNSSNSSVVGVYSSSSDPVHVPSLHSRPAANVGAIRREVGVVGPRRQLSENSPKPSSSQDTSVPNTQSGRDGQSRDSVRSFNTTSKNDRLSQNMVPDSSIPGLPVSRTFSSNTYGGRSHQVMGHQKVKTAPQPNKEWKPKASVKPNANGPGIIGSPAKTVSPPADNPEDMKKETALLQDNLLQVKTAENPNVIIAPHIRVSDMDRCRLTFGSLGSELETAANLIGAVANGVEEISTELSGSDSVSAAEPSLEEPVASKQLEMVDDSVRSSGSSSPASNVSDHQPTEKKVSTSPQNLNDYADVGLLQGNSPSYTPEPLQQQDTSELPSFSGYDPQMAYDMSYFRPVDDTFRGPGLPSSQEVIGVHTANALPASTIAMVQQQQQQQQQQLAQMYPQLHISHFANMMPYRQFLSPVYVPPIPVPGYSNSPPYPHPSNGSSYLLMPGNSSHLTPSGVKYGIQQFKPVPTGSPTGFGNFTSPAGYAVNTPGGVASNGGHDDSSRLKYKDNLYLPNPQAETSEIWMNPRDVSGLQPSYYNIPGQTPHPSAYLTSHSGHASFNAAAAAAQQPSHMQYPGMYHPSPQQPIASPHHLGPTIGGNVGVGVAAPAPGAQVGAYQQPQLGHLNWTGNF